MKPKSVKSIVEQLRDRAALLDRYCAISNAKVYLYIAEQIESGKIFLPEFSEKV